MSTHKMNDDPEPLCSGSTVKRLGWAQVYHVLTLDKELSDGAFRLYVLLLKYARQSGGCWPGVERLAQDLGKTKSTIKARLAELAERGLVTRERRFGASSITRMEDLEQVYDEPENGIIEQSFEEPENRPTKGQRTGRHEEHPDKNMQQGDDDSSSEQHTITSLLTDFGVDSVVARRLARKCTVDQVHGWIAHTNRKRRSLHNPAGFLVSKLQSGEPPPSESNDDNDDNEYQARTCQCGHHVYIENTCEHGCCYCCTECWETEKETLNV
ncbi:MAG: helix-turn-helix domain-containing protein [Chloroflexota bacterium]|nr:helix-turn-helix domain-containing protein [Chloroflexota bacterium]